MGGDGGVGLGGVGALFTLVVGVAASVDEHGGVGFGLTKEPTRMLGIVGGFDRVVEKTFAEGGKNEAVTIGVFVVAGLTTAETDDRVLIRPAGARNDEAGFEAIVGRDVGGGFRRDGGVEPDGTPAEAGFGGRHARTSEQMLGGGVVKFAGNPRESDDGTGVAAVTNAQGVTRRVVSRHRRAQEVATHGGEVSDVALVDSAVPTKEFETETEVVVGKTPIRRAFGE